MHSILRWDVLPWLNAMMFFLFTVIILSWFPEAEELLFFVFPAILFNLLLLGFKNDSLGGSRHWQLSAGGSSFVATFLTFGILPPYMAAIFCPLGGCSPPTTPYPGLEWMAWVCGPFILLNIIGLWRGWKREAIPYL